MNMPLLGACQCGALTYRLHSDPIMVYACHCTDCQKRSGSAFSMRALLPIADLAIQGELSAWSRQSDAGLRNTRYSCVDCGNIIYGEGENAPGIAKLQVGTLLCSQEMQPHVHLWLRSAQRWFVVDKAVPAFETQAASAEELLQAGMRYKQTLEGNS